MKKLFTQLVVPVGLSFLPVTGCRKDDQPSPPDPPPGTLGLLRLFLRETFPVERGWHRFIFCII